MANFLRSRGLSILALLWAVLRDMDALFCDFSFFPVCADCAVFFVFFCEDFAVALLLFFVFAGLDAFAVWLRGVVCDFLLVKRLFVFAVFLRDVVFGFFGVRRSVPNFS